MRRLVPFLVLIIILSVGYTSQTNKNWYNTTTGKIYCDSEPHCWHEIAHASDHETMNNVSGSAEFDNAVKVYCETEEESAWHSYICFFPGIGNNSRIFSSRDVLRYDYWYGWGGEIELYASIIQHSLGNELEMPEAFREFYDYEDLQDRYESLTITSQ